MATVSHTADAASPVPDCWRALAEALSPLSHSLAAGLLIRPVPLRTRDADPEDARIYAGDAARALCQDLDALLKETVPEMKESLAALEHCSLDDIEEIVDDLAAAALDLVDMARKVWEAPLTPEAEGARALLATLAEAPAVELLSWILQVMHLVLDPYSMAEDPAKPELTFVLSIPDAPVRDALNRWRKNNPGILPEELLR